MPMDQWGWQTTTPDFVQAGLHGSVPEVMPGNMSGGMLGGFNDLGCAPSNQSGYGQVPYSMASGFSHMAPLGQSGYGEMGGISLDQMHSGGQQGQMQMFSNSAPAMPMGSSLTGGAMMQQSFPAPGGQFSTGEDPGQLMQLKAEYEWQIQSKDQKFRDLQQRLGRVEAERAKMQSDFDRDRLGLMRHLKQLSAAVEMHGIAVEGAGPSEELSRPHTSSSAASAPAKGKKKGLNSNMEKLNSLLHCPVSGKGQDKGKSKAAAAASYKGGAAATVGQRREKGTTTFGKGSHDMSAVSESAVPSGSASQPGGNGIGKGTRQNARGSAGAGPKPRVSFPEELVQSVLAEPSNEEGEVSPSGSVTRSMLAEEVASGLRALEQRTASVLDLQARDTLKALSANDALEALRRTEDLVQDKDNHCDNVSSVLQSVCHKIRRRNTDGSGRKAVCRARGGQESASSPRHAPSQTAESETGSGAGDAREATDPRNQRTSKDAKESRAPQSGVHRAGAGVWSTGRFDHLARRGAFVIERDDDSNWSLKIRMQELEPALIDEDMQVYCRWLHQRLQGLRQELDLRSLRQLRTEVNFSRNGLTDDAVARLLQALQRSELHVVCLNLYANRIGPVGARHISDFLWEASSAVREVHLSHNEIDDDAAVEMIRLLADHPKYQPRKGGSGVGELLHPVWLRLNNNSIQQPRNVLRVLENELGITFCLARNRHSCGPTKCACRGSSGFPLLHLHSFELQDCPGASSADSTWEQRFAQRSSDAAVSNRRPFRRTVNEGNPAVAEVAGAQLQFPGRSSGVAHALASRGASSPQQLLSPPSPLDNLSGREEEDDAEVMLLESEVMCNDTGLGSPTADAAACSDGSPSLGMAHQLKANLRPLFTTSTAPVRGVPEVTPEPDMQLHSGLSSGRMAKVIEEEEEEVNSPLPQKVKLTGPPKILQRGKAPPEGMLGLEMQAAPP